MGVVGNDKFVCRLDESEPESERVSAFSLILDLSRWLQYSCSLTAYFCKIARIWTRVSVLCPNGVCISRGGATEAGVRFQ